MIVAADHGALKIANLHAYDCSLDPSKENLFRGHWPIGPKNVIREPSHYGKRGQLCGLIKPPHPRQLPLVFRHAHTIVAARVGVMMQLLRLWIDEVFEEIYIEQWQDARLSLDEEESTGSKPTKRARLEDNANSSSTKVDVRPTQEQIDKARMALHARIRPMTFKEYNDLEGNMDQIADPSEHC